VADGVSSWQRYGVNPALFAWELMVRCEEAAIKHAGKLEVGMLENYGKQTNRQGFSLLLETPIPCGNLRGIKDRFFFAWTLSLTCFNVLDACRK
jgi:hypothetical protein